MKERIRDLTDNLSKTIVGKEDAIRLVIVAMLSGGHILLEDVPGVGKTLLAKSLARSVNGRFQRIQCTPDLLPSDITGTNIWNPNSREFEFLSGPVFANVLLADEINRATPRTQSALLEVMEEQQVTVDGEARKVPKPFFVVATQNPVEYQGTFPLPEAQMDRFIISLSLGYPGFSEEVDMLQMHQSRILPDDLAPCISLEEVRELQAQVREIHVEKSIQEYIVKITQKSRNYEGLILGVSPRGTVALQRAAQAYAYLADRTFITTDDIKYLAPFVLAHRTIVSGGKDARDVIKALVATITDPSTPDSGYSLPTS
ncbi:MAG: MoxR family ATPase [Limnothrix sp. RL_2_0]|nr:MoxR family ATPase [Limnothrix sp. RL_2_0]